MLASDKVKAVKERFRPSFDGHGFIAVSRTSGLRLRNWPYVILRVVRFEIGDDDDVVALSVDDFNEPTAGFVVVRASSLTPIHEIPHGMLKTSNCLYWPSRATGGLRGVMRRIKDANQ